jgi:hypothetical protein
VIVYKLTDEKLQTHAGFQWEVGKKHGPLSGKGKLCGPGWFHAYHSPELAVLMNPTHAAIKMPLLWRAKASGKTLDDYGLKLGVQSLKLVEQIPLPIYTTNRRVAFGIYCAWQVYDDDAKWRDWTCGWLSGADRSANAAYAAAYSANAAANPACAAANAANAAAYATYAAANAATYAANAAAYAVCAKGGLDLQKYALKALEFESPALARKESRKEK